MQEKRLTMEVLSVRQKQQYYEVNRYVQVCDVCVCVVVVCMRTMEVS